MGRNHPKGGASVRGNGAWRISKSPSIKHARANVILVAEKFNHKGGSGKWRGRNGVYHALTTFCSMEIRPSYLPVLFLGSNTSNHRINIAPNVIRHVITGELRFRGKSSSLRSSKWRSSEKIVRKSELPCARTRKMGILKKI